MKKWIAIAIVLSVVVGGYMIYKRRAAEAAEAEANKPEFARVELGSIKQIVECTGRVVSNLDVEIKCKASGEIISLPFDVSDEVKKGDLLLELGPVDQARSLQQAEAQSAASQARLAQATSNLAAAEQNLVAERARVEASVRSAEARVADAEAKARRDQDLLEKKHVSIEEAETSRTTAAEARANLATAEAQLAALEAQQVQLEASRQDIRLAEVQIESDQAALGLAQQRLADTKVVSPIDGVVSTRPVQVGQIIASGVSNVGGGTTVMTIADLSQIFVLASVDESDIGEVKVGQKATITADAYPGVAFTGEVQRIASKGTNVSNVVTFEVKIEVTSENKRLLKPEMTANLEILVAEGQDVLVVPIRALSRKGMDNYLTLANDEQVQVTTGISDGNNIEIVTGASEGQEIILVREEEESGWRREEQRRTPQVFGRPRS